MNPRTFVVGLVAAAAVAAGLMYGFLGGRASTAPAPATRTVTDVPYDVAIPVVRTFLCAENGQAMRDWNFVDRWVKPQLTHDTYTVDGRTYNAFRIVTDDAKLPRGNVRFRKVIVNIGDGPVLEGHSYLNTRINGAKVKMERELLFVEFNGRLERQRRPLPACGVARH